MSDKKSEHSGHFGAAYSLNSKEATLAHYRDWAASYDREVGEEKAYAQPARAAQALSALMDHPADAELFDAGCGSGLSGVAFAAAGFSQIDGIDFSPEMLAKAAEKRVYRSLSQADLNEPIDCSDRRYDAVTAIGVFSFGHVDPSACRELLRILKPGGALVIAVNAPYWDEGKLSAELDMLEKRRQLEIVSTEFGEHLPGAGVKGWVISARKPS